MRKVVLTIAAVSLLTAFLGQSARADDPWITWTKQIRTIIERNRANAEMIATNSQNVRCPQQLTQTSKNACVAAYNVIVARMGAERAEMELKVAAVSLTPPNRDKILQNILSGYESMNRETMAMGDQFDLLFPILRQSSGK